MQFLVGIQVMSQAEKASLLAQITCLTSTKLVAQTQWQQSGHKIKRGAQQLTQQVRTRLGKTVTSEPDLPLIPAGSKLLQEIEAETNRLLSLSPQSVEVKLRLALADLAQKPPTAKPDQIASSLVERAAKSLPIDRQQFPDPIALGEEIFSQHVQAEWERIQRSCSKMTPQSEAELTQHLQQVIANLSQAEREELSKTINVDQLSAAALLHFIKTTSAVALSQLIVNGFGFGAFLFMTTLLKSFSLLLGVTLPFGVYTAMTSTLSFLLGAPFFLLVTAATGGLTRRRLHSHIGDLAARMVVVAGHSKALLGR